MSHDIDYDLNDDDPISPVILDKFGNIVDGFHRQESKPDWFSITNDAIDTPLKLEIARLKVNTNRRIVDAAEISKRLEAVYEEYKKEAGEYPAADEVAEGLHRSVNWVYKYLPPKYKSEVKAESGKTGGVESGASRREAHIVEDTPEESEIYKINDLKHVRPGVWKILRTGDVVGDFVIQSDPRYLTARRQIAGEPAKIAKEAYDTAKHLNELSADFDEARAKNEPYSKGFSETASVHRKATNTPTENKMQDLLSYIPDLAPDYDYFVPIEGQYRCPQCGRVTEEAGNCSRCDLPLQQKTYHPDAVIDDWLVLEVEGEGSKSKGNEKRDAYLTGKGKNIIHIPNECVRDYPEVLTQFIGLLHKVGRPMEVKN